MYVLKTDLTIIVKDSENYTSPITGKKWGSTPKSKISELAKVIEIEKPEIYEATQKITGFTIDETYTQVWIVEDLTADELEVIAKGEWANEFYSLDNLLPRATEDLMALSGIENLPVIQQTRYARKIELRAIGKEQGYI